MPPESKKKPSVKRQHNLGVGQDGENRASEYLRVHGYSVLAHNWRCGQDEIDLIALDTKYQEIVFVEVKTRHNDNSGNPALAVNRRKMNAQQRAAQKYLRETKDERDYRFDIISVLPDKIEHFENVTFP